MEESNSYEVTAEEASDRGICARALYDYQAGEFFWSRHHNSKLTDASFKEQPNALFSLGLKWFQYPHTLSG